ncbi:MAG: hypothetical protein RIK87_12070 [Fuerstiella sp.]
MRAGLVSVVSLITACTVGHGLPLPLTSGNGIANLSQSVPVRNSPRHFRKTSSLFSAPETLIGPLSFQPPAAGPAPRAHAHPHGDKVCASGCALSRHPTPPLSNERFLTLIGQLDNLSRCPRVIDELLFYGPQTRTQLRQLSVRQQAALSLTVTQTLLEELRLTHAVVELRLVSATGELLADLSPQCVPLDLRHEFDLHEHGLPPLLASGTVKRVGRYRLWSRL